MKPILAASLVSCLALAGPARAQHHRCDLDESSGAEVLVRYSIPHVDDPTEHVWDHIPWGYTGPVAVAGSVLASDAPAVIGIGDVIPGGPCELLWQEREPDPQDSYEIIRVGVTEGLTSTSSPTFSWGPPRPPLPWDVAGVFDLTGDGRADVLWWNPETGSLMLWVRLVTGWSVVAVADRLPPSQDSEGAVPPAAAIVRVEPLVEGPPGILWQPSENGSAYRFFQTSWNGQALTIDETGVVPGLDAPGWRLAALGDFDRDGKDDVLQQRVGDSNLRICFMDGLTVRDCVGATPPSFALPDYRHGWVVAGPR